MTMQVVDSAPEEVEMQIDQEIGQETEQGINEAQMEVDEAPPAVQTEQSQQIEPPTGSQATEGRSRRTRQLPLQYWEMDLAYHCEFLLQAIPEPEPEPEEPAPEPTPVREPTPVPEPSPERAPPPSDPFIVLHKDSFGLFKIHRFKLPSRDPDKDIGMDDLIDSTGFSVTRRRGRRPNAVFRRPKPDPQPPAGDPKAPPKPPPPYAPFSNPITFRIMDWFYNASANSVSLQNINDLVDIFRQPDYHPSHIATFDSAKEASKLDNYEGEEIPAIKKGDISSSLPFGSYSGWQDGYVDIPLPCAGTKCKENNACKF
ncbi:hypothetical protein PM082_004303 [Marasmius tenuissimus]|nr:hypothetical protein PM082_004303 [Marasmius tenuissimus]